MRELKKDQKTVGQWGCIGSGRKSGPNKAKRFHIYWHFSVFWKRFETGDKIGRGRGIGRGCAVEWTRHTTVVGETSTRRGGGQWSGRMVGHEVRVSSEVVSD